jgi:hypothetical protein
MIYETAKDSSPDDVPDRYQITSCKTEESRGSSPEKPERALSRHAALRNANGLLRHQDRVNIIRTKRPVWRSDDSRSVGSRDLGPVQNKNA